MADFSVYDFEKKGTVSIWVSVVPDLPTDYFKQHYGEEEDQPFSQFSEDFGFGYFNHDSVDTYGSTQFKPLEQLLGPCSFSSSYIRQAVAEAKHRGLEKSNFVFLLYDIEYSPERTRISKSSFMEFLGSFPYDDESPSSDI